jgi:stringent starvation protein B
MEDENKNKYDFLLSLLSEGDAMICLDARLPDVDVPKNHKDNPSLNLILNLNFRRPLDVQKEGVCVTLAFQGRPHPCVIPFDAVWAVFDPTLKKGQVWEESIPADINLEEHLQVQTQEKSSSPNPKASPSVSNFPLAGASTLPGEISKSGKKPPKIIAGGKKTDSDQSPRPQKDRSHLRVIK